MSIKTQGTELYAINPTGSTPSLIDIGCVQSISGISTPVETIETTCLADTARTFIAGLKSPGTFSFEINWDPADATHVLLQQLKEAGTTLKWAVGHSDGVADPTIDSNGDFVLPTTRSWIDFSGFQTDFPFDFNQNEVAKSSVSVQISGNITVTPKT